MGVARLMASLGSRSGMRLRPIAASGGAARSSRSGTKGIRTASSCTDRERMYGAHSTRTSLSAHSPSSNGPEFACDSSQRRPLLRVALLYSAPSAQLRPQWHVEQAFFFRSRSLCGIWVAVALRRYVVAECLCEVLTKSLPWVFLRVASGFGLAALWSAPQCTFCG